MPSQLVLRQSIEYNYRFQYGMYFNGRKKINGAVIFYSDYIEDSFWNFAIEINTTAGSIPMLIKNVEKEMNDLNRQPAFYIAPWTEPLDQLVENLSNRGYQRRLQDTWMFFDESSEVTIIGEGASDLAVKVANSESKVEDFVNVYGKVYADKPTAEEPDGSLPLTYIKALRQSFSPRDVDTLHFIGYKHSQPIAIATLVYANGWGGIYNVGTLSEHRHQGFGSLITQACIDKWKELGGHTLFLQTEEGIIGEKLYGRLGFNTAFIGECWAR